jgi:hypothetical protein
MACNFHELIKTGEIPSSSLKAPSSREEIYPELYDDVSSDEIPQILTKYATEQPTKRPRKNQKQPLSSTTEKAEASSDTEEVNTNTHLDVWGNLPPKEPKQTVECQLCGRHVATSRFATHLDKCMGLSTTRGQVSTLNHHTSLRS